MLQNITLFVHFPCLLHFLVGGHSMWQRIQVNIVLSESNIWEKKLDVYHHTVFLWYFYIPIRDSITLYFILYLNSNRIYLT